VLFLICGPYKSGKTVSAATFPQPILWEDWDDGFKAVTHFNKEAVDVEVVPLYGAEMFDLSFETSMASKGNQFAPPYTKQGSILTKAHNEVFKELKKDGLYKGRKYRTLVIDSLTNAIRAWKETVLQVNSRPSLIISDYLTLENVLYSQFIPSLKALLRQDVFDHIVVVDHIATDKDELTGAIQEFPVGPSVNMGKNMGLHFDEIYLQQLDATGSSWHTRRKGLFVAGSRLNLPPVIKPATFGELSKFLPKG